MANVQRQFKKFIEDIKLGTTEEEQILRDRRELVKTALRKGLKADFGARGETPPSFTSFDQGSYSLKTGIKPVDGNSDYDIDTGIVFDIDPDDHQDNPVRPKMWVRDALEGRVEAESIEIKSPCVTVTFADGCHVDLAVYADPQKRTGVELPLSWGKEHSSNKEWQLNFPSQLAEEIKSKFADKDERHQFRRVLRALKRWRDLKYKSATSHAAPVGVGLTVAGLTLFSPEISVFHSTQDDRKATEQFVDKLLEAFKDNVYSQKDGENGRRLVVALPFTPHKDVFARITNKNMTILEERLKDLLADLKAADLATTNKEACKFMRKQFGDDFPEGEDESDDSTRGSKTQARAIIGSTSSGG